MLVARAISPDRLAVLAAREALELDEVTVNNQPARPPNSDGTTRSMSVQLALRVNVMRARELCALLLLPTRCRIAGGGSRPVSRRSLPHFRCVMRTSFARPAGPARAAIAVIRLMIRPVVVKPPRTDAALDPSHPSVM